MDELLFREEDDHPVTIVPHPRWGRPQALAYKILQAIFLKLVEEGYQSIELPMPSITLPEFAMEIDWMAEEMLGYLRTWSASRRYLMDKGSDPVSLIEGRLLEAWGAGTRQASWPLNLKIGRA